MADEQVPAQMADLGERVSGQKAEESDDGEEAEMPDQEGEGESEDAGYPEDDDELDEGEDDGDEGDEGEELEDEAALEDEELRSDARGVEEHDGDMDED